LLLDTGLDVQVCGSTMKKFGWDEGYSLPEYSSGLDEGTERLDDRRRRDHHLINR
jgi:hypothetical protein